VVELASEEESQPGQYIPDPDTNLRTGELNRPLFQKGKTAIELVAAKVNG
jgi:hypothetical protein